MRGFVSIGVTLSVAVCAIAGACVSRSGQTFVPADAVAETTDSDHEFGGVDGSPSESRACHCDAGGLEIQIRGEGGTNEVLAYPNPRGECSDSPSGYFFACGDPPWTTESIAACGPPGDGACLAFDINPTRAGFVDRDGGVWDLGAAAIDLDDGGEGSFETNVKSGVFAVAATRVGCEDAGCEMELLGSFRVCAFAEAVPCE